MSNIIRCGWCTNDPIYKAYHDEEWGVPKYDDPTLFEMLVLEGAQAGLSWLTILRKRERYRYVFYDFEVARVAAMTESDVERLMQDAGIVRNQLKIRSAIRNAKVFLHMQKEHGSFSHWLWQHVHHAPIINSPKTLADIPATSPLSDKISQSLKKSGMNFVGSTIIYAFLQSTGVVNDHTIDCHCYCHSDPNLHT